MKSFATLFVLAAVLVAVIADESSTAGCEYRIVQRDVSMTKFIVVQKACKAIFLSSPHALWLQKWYETIKTSRLKLCGIPGGGECSYDKRAHGPTVAEP